MILAPRYLPRLAAVVGLFTRYGLRDFARKQGLHRLAPDAFDESDEDQREVHARAVAFRRRLVELGPAYIKLGQVLSTRPDLLPPAFIQELEKLQDDVSPIPYEDVERTLQEEFGARISKLFASFDPEPLGSASLGQVHAATLRDGREVVVKVQRPGIIPRLEDDVAFFHEVAVFLAEHTEAGQRVDLVGVIQQLERALADELDYRVEARNAAAFRRSLAEFPRLLIPRVVEAYSSRRVLTTERIRGVKVNEIPPIARTEHDFHPVADEFAKAYLKQIAIDGHFHADPHPGNIFVVLPGAPNPWTPAEVVAHDRRLAPRTPVTPLARAEQEAQREAAPYAPESDVKLAIIDFGMTAHLSTSTQEHVIRLLLDLADNRGEDAADTLIEMGQPLPGFDRQTYVHEIAALMAENHDLSVGEIQAGAVLYEVIDRSYQRGLRLPAELTLLAKALFNLDAITRALDPSYSPVQAVREFGQRLANERASEQFSLRRVYQTVTETSELMANLPHRLDLITQRLAANELGVGIDIPQLEVVLRGMQKIANRIFTGLVLTGLLIASAMLMPYRRSLGTAGFIIAAVIGLFIIVSILTTDRGRPQS